MPMPQTLRLSALRSVEEDFDVVQNVNFPIFLESQKVCPLPYSLFATHTFLQPSWTQVHAAVED